MVMITYPLNNIEYRAEDAELFHCTRTSGVWAENSFTCTVSGEDNNITVDKGVAWIQNTEFAGKVVAMKGVTVIDAGVADDLNDRIDVVAIQFDANENETKIVVKHGDPVLTNPQIPEINRSGGLFELYLCSIYRTAGKTAISAFDVTDLRLNPDYCGLMADSVTKIDTSMIESQVTELIDFLKSQIDDISLTAENVTYDNSESEIEAENLQDAVDHIIQSIIDAKKVATNYLSENNSGSLEVGIVNGNSWKGYRVQIASDAINILDKNGSKVASFASNVVKFTASQIDVSGKIRGQVTGGSYHKGRDNALIASTNSASATGYYPFADVKARTGDWSIGCLDDSLYFVRTTDSDYNSNTNSTKKIIMKDDGSMELPNSVVINPGSTSYIPFTVKRIIGSTTYQIDFGVGNPATGEASAQLRLVDSSGTALNNFVLRTNSTALSHGSFLAPGGFEMSNSAYLYGGNTAGVKRILIGINVNNNLVVGYGGYEASEGTTNIYGNGVRVTSKASIHLIPQDNAYGFIGVSYASSKPLIYPNTNGGGYCGSTSYRWAAVYAVNGTIQTSDRNAKENILDISEKYEELFMRLRPVTYKLKGKEHDRTHVGFVAQEVEEAMAEVGLTAEDFAALCIDDKTEYDEETGEERIVLDENGEPVKLYSLRYQEMDGIYAHMIQKLMKRIEELEKRIA